MDNNKLEQIILSAVKKVGGKKENDICHYIPAAAGGYIHHFTLRKMKTEDPQQLGELLNKYIINQSNPQKVTPKSRAARGSRKRKDLFTFSKNDLERMLNMARIAGDKEMIRKLTPKKDLKTIKRELLSSVRNGRVEQELWNFYVETVTSQAAALTPAFAGSIPATV
jgi:hypothetical protein